jgi:LuxR family transcriptional regulator, maltose regulon positive regulatory protein
MLTSILATKLYLPPFRPGVVTRPHLIERLNAGLRQNPGFGPRLTLISAPAGFGKTTLVSEWLSDYQQIEPGLRAAWLSLDAGDNDPTCFLTYLVAAMQTVEPKMGEGVLGILQALQSQPPPLESLLTNLLNELAALPDRLMLVLDDYHVIEAPALNQALTFFIEHLPPKIHLVIATREDPLFPLARWRGRGQLSELRAADLRFAPSETSEFLNRVMGLNLSEGEIAALENRTEGWIAGLRLAAISLQGRADIAGFIQAFTGSHHFVLDYLVEEVLQKQSAGVQTFLLKTSILDRLCGSLCEAVCSTGSGPRDPVAGGQATLEYLEHANLFIVPLDDERRWYRYHHLFADLLRQRLQHSPLWLARDERSGVDDLHRRASQWYEENGDRFSAFQHALAARDFSRAAGLAEMTWMAMDSAFQSAGWLGWTRKLPEDVIRIRPVLCAHIAQSLADMGDAEASESRLQDAERGLQGLPAARVTIDEKQLRSLPGEIAMTRSYNLQILGRLADSRKYAELALQLIPEDDFFRRAQATITLEIIHWASGDLEAARRAMVDWMQRMEQSGNLVFVVASAFALADILVAQGQLREAEKIYLQSLKTAAAQGPEAQRITAHHYLGLAMLAHETGNYEKAAGYFEKARELDEQTTLVDWPYRWRLARAQLKESQGDLVAALDLLDQAGRAYVRNPVPNLRPVEALKARIYLKQGRLPQAQQWMRDRRLSSDTISYLLEFEHLVLARVLIAGYFSSHDDAALRQAGQLLERLLKAAEEQKRTGSLLEILLVQALAFKAQGNLALALAALERALSLAEPEGYQRIFVDEGEAIRRLLVEYKSAVEKRTPGDIHSLLGYTLKILEAFTPPLAASKSTIFDYKSDTLESLSPAELKILQLIARGLSNSEIGERLFLALSTIKGHNRVIFDKLQVQNRTEAVARARELGLI